MRELCSLLSLVVVVISPPWKSPTNEITNTCIVVYTCTCMYVCTSMYSNVKVRMLQDYHIQGKMWKTEWISGKSWSFTITYT